jgi:hypothetical protein
MPNRLPSTSKRCQLSMHSRCAVAISPSSQDAVDPVQTDQPGDADSAGIRRDYTSLTKEKMVCETPHTPFGIARGIFVLSPGCRLRLTAGTVAPQHSPDSAREGPSLRNQIGRSIAGCAGHNLVNVG